MTSLPRLSGLPHVEPLEQTLAHELQHVIDTKTKPPGSLGRLETLARQMGLIQRTTHPRCPAPRDDRVRRRPRHRGRRREPLSASGDRADGREFSRGRRGDQCIEPRRRASSSKWSMRALRRRCRRTDGLVDIPVGGRHAQLRARTRDDARRRRSPRCKRGAARVRHHAALGTNVIGFGEMGIANTSAAACLMSRLCGVPIDECVGRGTGLDDAGLAQKRNVLAAALARHHASTDPLDVLATFGGFEIAMMAGAYLAAAQARMTILVDGFIATFRAVRRARDRARRARILRVRACVERSGTRAHARLFRRAAAAVNSTCVSAKARAPRSRCRCCARRSRSSTKWRASNRPA